MPRKERLTARNGCSYLALRLRDRSGTIARPRLPRADRIGLRFEPGDAIDVRGKVERFRGELVAELDDVRRLEPGSFDPAEFLPAAYRSVEELEGFLEHLVARDPRPGPARRRRGGGPRGPAGRGVPARALHPRRPPRLPRRPARAHGRRRHAGRRGLPAPPAARLRPADGGGAPPRRRQGARVHLRRRVRDQRRGPDARPPGDRRRDRRRRRRLAAGRAPAGAAPLRALPPRPRRRARSPGGRARLRLPRGAGALPAQRLDASVKGALER